MKIKKNLFMKMTYFILITVVFLILLFFIIYWSFIIKDPPTLPSPIEYSKASYGMSCSATPKNNSEICQDGLTCESNICKVSLGSPCININQCVSEALQCADVCTL
jgi:hypothetical protein